MFDLCHTEVLPLVEFVIDSSLTDEEAVQILDLSIPKQKKEDRGWKEGRIGRILVNFFFLKIHFLGLSIDFNKTYRFARCLIFHLILFWM